MGNINDLAPDTINVISMEHASLIQYPVVSLGQHGTHFYDINELLTYINTSGQNIFPHNRQRINWETDIDAVVWDNPHPSLPHNYVKITLERIDAAEAYSDIWYIKSQPEYNEPGAVRVRLERYIEYRNERSKHTFEYESNTRLYNGHLAGYWRAHPYSEKDRELGIQEPNAGFLEAQSTSPEHFDKSYQTFRHWKATDIERYFLDDENAYSDDDSNYNDRAVDQRMRWEICRYWDAHPPNPLFDDAYVIKIVIEGIDSMRHWQVPQRSL
jgi:hypothetical protein